MVEPVDPFQCGKFYCLESTSWSVPMNDLSLVKPVDRLGDGIVINVAGASDRRLDASF